MTTYYLVSRDDASAAPMFIGSHASYVAAIAWVNATMIPTWSRDYRITSVI